MTYATDIATNGVEVFYYVEFEGIETRIATHDFSAAVFGLSGTFLPCLLNISLGERKLERMRGVVTPASFSMECADDANVRALFARKGNIATLSTGVTDSGTSFATNEPIQSGWTSGTKLYIDRETVEVSSASGTTAGTYTVTRADESSVSSWHREGAILSDKPRHWKDRRYTVYAVTQNGNTSELTTGYLTGSPEYSEGVWSLGGADLMSALSNDVNVGFDLVEVNEQSTYSYPNVAIPVPDASLFAATGEAVVEWTIGDQNEKTQVHRIVSRDTVSTPNTITVYGHALETLEGDSEGGNFRRGGFVRTVKQRMTVEGTPKEIALQLLLSVWGDGSNDATYDTLPGYEPGTADGASAKANHQGLQLDSSLVDKTTFDAIDKATLDGVSTLHIDESVSFVDLWANELSWRVGGFLYEDGGQIKFKRYDLLVPSDVTVDLNTSHYAGLEFVVRHDEADVMSRLNFQTNYSQKENAFKNTTNLVVVGPDRMYFDERASSMFKASSVWIGAPSKDTPRGALMVSEVDIVMYMDRHIYRVGEGLELYSFRLPWRYSESVTIGSLVKITDDRVPNTSGTLGVTEVECEVTSVTVDLARREIEVVCERIEQGFLVAPSMFVGSWDAGNLRASIVTTGIRADMYSDDPRDHWAVGWQCRMYDRSASPAYSASDTLEIAGFNSATEIEFTSAPSFTPGSLDLLCLEYTASPSANTADFSGATQDRYLYQCSDGNYLGTYPSHEDGSKWS